MRPELHDVPETMLWTLHNRASESLRSDSDFEDRDAVRIYKAIDYDYERSFGPAEPSHAIRSRMFDNAIRRFAQQHGPLTIVNLGEGLETQRFRLADLDARWLSVDVPSAIDVRERFIDADEAHRHVSLSALDRDWFDEVPTDRPIFISAQGLFMYFAEDEVQNLIADLAKRFRGARLMFDTIPPWLSRKTTSGGWKKTAHYTTPPMPWGINRTDLPKLASWSPHIAAITDVPWERFPRGAARWLFPVFTNLPILRGHTPAAVAIDFAP